MRRRAFVIGGVATALSYSVRAQQAERKRRVGVLIAAGGEDAEAQARQSAFLDEMRRLGWIEGRNIRFDVRWGSGNTGKTRQFASELVAMAPDVVLAAGNAAVEQLRQASQSLPIVFAIAVDPVGSGFVDSLSRPSSNATGFMQFEYSLTAKWLELLKQIAPGVTRVAVLRDAATTAGIGQFAVIQSIASQLGVEVSPINGRTAPEIESAISSFAGNENAGLIVTSSAMAGVHRELIISLATRYKLPAIYSNSVSTAAGGLLSYGADLVDQYRRAAIYVDRILRGEKLTNLPVQAPSKYELVVNLKTAKEIGIVVPPTLLNRADRVIEDQ